MKKALTFLMLLFITTVNAQWTALTSGTTATLNSICFSDPDTGFTVSSEFSAGGKVFSSVDGSAWNQQYILSDYLFTVHARQGGNIWAGGGAIGGGIIIHSNDNGSSWNIQTTTVEQIASISFYNDTLGWAAGNDATQGIHYIYKTIDGGQTWIQTETGQDYLRNIYFITATTGYAAGDNGKIYKTTDGGNSWTLLSTGVVFHFQSVHFISSSVGWAAGYYAHGGIYKTTDGGQTWQSQSVPVTANLHSIYFVSPNSGYAVGDSGVILKTGNGGLVWQQENSPVTDDLFSVCFPEPATGYAAGQNGTIIKYELTSFIKEMGAGNGSIFPTVTTGIINLKGFNKVFALQVFSSEGRLVYSRENSEELQVDLSSLKSGLYIIKVLDEASLDTFKVILAK